MQRIKTFKTLTRGASAALFLAVQAVICIGTVLSVRPRAVMRSMIVRLSK